MTASLGSVAELILLPAGGVVAEKANWERSAPVVPSVVEETVVSEKSFAAPVGPFSIRRVPCESVTTVAVTPAPEPLMAAARPVKLLLRSEEHTSELQSLMRISYAVFCLKKKK